MVSDVLSWLQSCQQYHDSAVTKVSDVLIRPFVLSPYVRILDEVFLLMFVINELIVLFSSCCGVHRPPCPRSERRLADQDCLYYLRSSSSTMSEIRAAFGRPRLSILFAEFIVHHVRDQSGVWPTKTVYTICGVHRPPCPRSERRLADQDCLYYLPFRFF